MSTIKYPYKQLSPTIKRPIIRVEIAKAKGADGVPCQVLVDSGADCSVFKAEIGDILGLDVEAGRPVAYSGVHGGPVSAYEHLVWLEVKGTWIQLPAVFSREFGDNMNLIVGQMGFFEAFEVTFNYSESAIELKTV